jgi:hypothetical protein
MNDSRWLKGWLEVNNSFYVGIGKDMLADIYNEEEGEDDPVSIG